MLNKKIRNFFAFIGAIGIAGSVLIGIAYAAPTNIFQKSIFPEVTDNYDLGSSTPAFEWNGLYVKTICLSGDCKSAWPTGGPGGGGAWPFTPSTSWGVAVQSTTTPLAINAVFASSTTALPALAGSSDSSGAAVSAVGNSSGRALEVKCSGTGPCFWGSQSGTSGYFFTGVMTGETVNPWDIAHNPAHVTTVTSFSLANNGNAQGPLLQLAGNSIGKGVLESCWTTGDWCYRLQSQGYGMYISANGDGGSVDPFKVSSGTATSTLLELFSSGNLALGDFTTIAQRFVVGSTTGGNTVRVNGLSTSNNAPCTSLFRSGTADWTVCAGGSTASDFNISANPTYSGSAYTDATIGSASKFTIKSSNGQLTYTFASTTALSASSELFAALASSSNLITFNASTTNVTVGNKLYLPNGNFQLLATDGNGATVATTSIGYNLLTGTPVIPTGANPSVSVGLSAANGSAATFMRSDAAPSLDQTIAPTMTGAWAFNNAASTTIAKGLYANTIAAQYFIATSSTATSTFANGIDLASGVGCFSISGTCLQTIVTGSTAYKQAVKYASTSTLPTSTYSNGVGGVGATLTGTANGPFYIDGNTPTVGDRVLVKNEGTGANNGIYTVTTLGVAGLTAFVLTRATDYNSSADVFPGVANFVNSGTVNANTCWILTNTSGVTIGTTALTYADECGAGSFTGTFPITLSGTNISFSGIATSAAPTIGNLSYWTSANTLGTVATTSVTCSGTVSCSTFNILGASPVTITGSGSSGGDPFTHPIIGQSATTSLLLVGTSTTQLGLLTLGTSTAPQLMLSDNTAADSIWAMRNASGAFALSTSTALTVNATAALAIDTSGNTTLQNNLTLLKGVMTVPIGAATTPQYTFTGATDTGLLGQAGDLQLYAGGNAVIDLATNQAKVRNGSTHPNLGGSTNTGSGLDWTPTNGLAIYANSVEAGRITSGQLWAYGTTTPFWELTVASSTGPQLALSDANPANFPWTFRSIAGSLYFATSTALATSTTAAFSINTFGQPVFPLIANGTGGCLQLSTLGAVTTTGGSCSGLSGWTAIKGGIYNSTTTDQVMIGETATTSIARLEVKSANAGLPAGYFNGLLTAGTTTPFWELTSASSSGPQLGLSDTNAANFAWTLRTINNNFYVATSTALATSTTAAFSLNANGIASFPMGMFVQASSTFNTALWASLQMGIATTTTPTNSGMGFAVATSTVFWNQVAFPYASSTAASIPTNQVINFHSGKNQRIIATTTMTVEINSTSSHPYDGATLILKVCQDSTGGRAVTFTNWSSGFINFSMGTPTPPTTGGTGYMYGGIWDGRVNRLDIIAATSTPRGSCTP